MTKLNNILLVEDDESTNFVNKRIIKKLGCAENVHIAYDGVEALDILTKRNDDSGFLQPELILLDINMPRMNGWEFMEFYKDLPQEQKANVVIFMLTTSMNPDDMRKAKELEEITGLEHKPLTEEMLLDIIEKNFG